MSSLALLQYRWRVAALLLISLITSAVYAQAPVWQMAIGAGGTGNSSVSATAADANGNVYIVGSFAGTITLGTTTLVNTGIFYHDLFVAKWNSSANRFLWARQAGGINEEQAIAVAVNGTSIYVAGYFDSPTVSFGALALANTSITSPRRSGDGFLAKLTDGDSTSTFDWVQQIGSGNTGDDSATGVAVNGENVYVTGVFDGPIARIGSTTLVNAGNYDVFVAKFIDAGGSPRFAWAQQAGGPRVDIASAIAVSGASIYITGCFYGAAAIFGTTSLTDIGSIGADIFVAKLTDAGSTGSFVWAQRGGGPGHEQAWAMAVSGANVYVTGIFEQVATVFGNTTLPNAGDFDIFVTKLSDVGATASFAWAVAAGGSGSDTALGLAVSGANVFVVGTLTSPSAVFGITPLVDAGGGLTAGADGFVARLVDGGTTGRFAWAQRVGSTGGDYITSVATAGATAYVGGGVAIPAAFGGKIIAGPAGNAGVASLASFVDSTLLSIPVGDCAGTGTSKGCPLLIPNIMTPNGDGHNDQFVCQGLSGDGWNLAIYNRWGRAVYQQSNYANDWDAGNQTAGIYYYVLNNPTSGQRYRGWVEVLR